MGAEEKQLVRETALIKDQHFYTEQQTVTSPGAHIAHFTISRVAGNWDYSFVLWALWHLFSLLSCGQFLRDRFLSGVVGMLAAE